MRIGNVIRDPDGGLWIVTSMNDYGSEPTVQVVSFDSENATGVLRLDDYVRKETCHCGDFPEFEGQPQEDCEDCHGAGTYERKVKGWKHSKVLAENAKDFIMKGLKGMFKF